MDVSFYNIPLHTALTLSVSVGAVTASENVVWGGASVEDGDLVPDLIQVLHKSNLAVTPFPIAFKPDLSLLSMFGIPGPANGLVYDARLHDLNYVWTYGEDYTYTAPQNGSFKQSGTSIGWQGAHVYRTVGTFNARLDVYGVVNGSILHVYGEYEVVVADPETVFAGDRTIFVSPSSDWTNCPAGAEQVTSFAQAFDAVQGSGSAPAGTSKQDNLPARIMLNRGETYNLTTNHAFGYNAAWVKSVHVVAGPGPGADPAISSVTMASNTKQFGFSTNDDSNTARKEKFKTCDFVMQDLDMEGGFNSVTETSDPSGVGAFALSTIQPNTILIDRCATNGYSRGISFDGSSDLAISGHTAVFANDWVFENFSSDGAGAGGFNLFSSTGCRITSHPDSYINNVGAGGWGYRVAGSGRACIIDACDFYIGQGWPPLAGGKYVAQGSCFRMGDGNGGMSITVTRSSFETGYQVVSFGATNRASYPCNVLFDSNYLLGNMQTVSMMKVCIGGFTIRNNIMVVPDAVRPTGTNNASNFMNLENGGTPENAENMAAPIRAYNNTFIDMVGGMVIHNAAHPFTGFVQENNVRNTVDGPLVQTPVRWLPRSKGYKSTTEYLPGTFTPADVVWPADLAPGNLGIGSAAGLVAMFDYDGELRGSNPSRGALEPA